VISRLEVVYLYVSDMERSLAFYRDLLGVPLEADANDPNWAEARLDGVRFALHLARPGAEPETRNTVRFDFRVDDIDAEMERLRAAGVECGAVMREPWGSLCELSDPDGYTVELFAPFA